MLVLRGISTLQYATLHDPQPDKLSLRSANRDTCLPDTDLGVSAMN